MTTVTVHEDSYAKEVAGYQVSYTRGQLRLQRFDTGLDLRYQIGSRPSSTTITLTDARQQPLPVSYRELSATVIEVTIDGSARPAQPSKTFESLDRTRREDQAWQRLGTSIAQNYRPSSW